MAISGLMRMYETIVPLATPIAPPMTMRGGAGAGSGQPSCTRRPATMPAAAIVEPTERSKPPAIITMVSPTATMPTIAIARPMLVRLGAVRKNSASS